MTRRRPAPEAEPESPPVPRPAGRRAAGLAVLVAVPVVLGATLLHLWFAVYVAGLGLGAATRFTALSRRAAIGAATLAALVGWSAPLLWRAAEHQPVAETARTAAAIAGLPASGALLIGVTLLVGILQGLLGVWLGRAVSGLVARPPRFRGRSRVSGDG